MQNTPNFISEYAYEQFVLEQLAPMSIECQKDHIYTSMQEELLELENVEFAYKALQNEIEIWEKVKPRVKFLRQYAYNPKDRELRDFMHNTVVNRTLDNGQKIAKTFYEHIEDLENERQRLRNKMVDELGDVLFFYVAAGSERLNTLSKQLYQQALDKLYFYVNTLKTTTFESLRWQNYQKLMARYTNGYNVKQDLLRK
jgi:hypothetical protein